MEKPIYKEKLRIRSYERVRENGSTVFVELKKKYNGVVYKRRLPLPYSDAMEWLLGVSSFPLNTQISREIDYFINFYEPLFPTMFLSYEREAYYDKSCKDFRITFDDQILSRREDIHLSSDVYGTPILPDGKILMELKCSGGIPLWMVEVLSREQIYKTSFSKYGTAYTTQIFPEIYLPNSIIH